MPFYDPKALKRKRIAPGAHIQMIWGDKVMMVYITLEPGAEVPLHTHPHEQAGMCLEGEFELTIGGEARMVKEGDAYLVPSGVEHRAVATAGRALALDIFSPPREDFIELLESWDDFVWVERNEVGFTEEFRYYSRPAVAAILGVSKQRVHQLTNERGVDMHEYGLPSEALKTLIENQVTWKALAQYKPVGHITVAEAAERLGVSEDTIKFNVMKVRIPCLKVGRRRWIREDWVADQ